MSTSTEDALKLALECERLRDFHDGKNQYLATVIGLREAARALRALVAERDEARDLLYWWGTFADGGIAPEKYAEIRARTHALVPPLDRSALTTPATAPTTPEQRSKETRP